jgi:glycerate kinase
VHVVAAFDKLRGTATASEAVAAVARAVAAAGATCEQVPLADGGEGTLEALGGPNRTTTVTGPLGDAVDAQWRLSGRSAVIEMAAASGLELVGGAEHNDPMGASTHGTGELISAAVEAGARRVIVGVGGSATTDGGLGCLRAMYPLHRFRGIELVVAHDVTTLFVDAAAVFGPQKGASPAQVKLLTRRLERLAQMYEEEYGVEVRELPGSGSAGGLGGGLVAIGATLESGFELIAEELTLDEKIAEADLVLTGEGFLDEQSFHGKVVGGVADLARAADVPVVAIAGQVFDEVGDRLPTVSLTERFGEEVALTDTVSAIERATAEILAEL